MEKQAEQCTQQMKYITTNVGLGAPNKNSFLYCSKVKNFVARFGVSARIGGRIPL